MWKQVSKGVESSPACADNTLQAIVSYELDKSLEFFRKTKIDRKRNNIVWSSVFDIK